MTILRFINGRIGRWLFPVLVLAAGFTRHGGGLWHYALGGAAALVAVLRIVEGFVGAEDARFVSMLRGAKDFAANLRALLHSPRNFSVLRDAFRGLLLSFVLAMTALAALTGILLTLDPLWSFKWLVFLHSLVSFLLFVSAVVYGWVYFPARSRKNQI